MKYLLTLIPILLLVSFAIGEAENSQRCCVGKPQGIGMVLASEIPVTQTHMVAAKLKTSTVSGELKFEKRRPKQPVVIFLQRVDGELTYELPSAETVKQKNARFEPSFLVVVKGQRVVFDNDEMERINHNVYFLGEEKKDLGIFGNDEKRGHIFGKAGEVEVYCSIHSMMDAKIFVAPNPHFAVLTKSETKFTLKNVPEGKYLLKTYQKAKRFNDVSENITVVAGQVLNKTITLKR